MRRPVLSTAAVLRSHVLPCCCCTTAVDVLYQVQQYQTIKPSPTVSLRCGVSQVLLCDCTPTHIIPDAKHSSSVCTTAYILDRLIACDKQPMGEKRTVPGDVRGVHPPSGFTGVPSGWYHTYDMCGGVCSIVYVIHTIHRLRIIQPVK